MAPHLRDGIPHALRTSHLHHSAAYPSLLPHNNTPHNNVDEGFSEEIRSQSDSDMMESPGGSVDGYVATLLRKVLELPADTRRYFAQDIVRSLANADKEVVKALIEGLIHFDPATYFPNEIMLQILSYLPAKDLLTASTISHTWRQRSQDERLWQCCFAREGWALDQTAVQSFIDKKANVMGAKVAEGGMLHRPRSLERRASRKRKTDEAFSENEGVGIGVGASSGHQTHSSAAPADRTPQLLSDGVEDRMEDVRGNGAGDDYTARLVGTAGSTVATDGSVTSLEQHDSMASSNSHDLVQDSIPSRLKLSPTLFQEAPSDQPKLSWAYLYKQRRRLERNWDKGLCTTFQLPHPDYPHEGHEECVYTIQHTTRHLVSGSRDKTIRIWDLETCRLVRAPLKEHEASVLCLQFDERPEHDIIVSGGSDTYVIVWQFSTGKVLKKMTNAHDESVLNLRFDDRYIVTCSKDKTIRIWSRHSLKRDDPLIPSHVVSKFNDASSDLADPIKEYTLLTTLTGHHAAVNAVMIHNDIIVSASGDRTIRGWDINTGHHVKTYAGHMKGIACVQYDGRRIVSGSSDNTVRIFDADSQAEIACLVGHTELVRTVQARFGDLATTTNAELAAEARRVEREFMRAVSRGALPPSANRRAQRNAGSSRPEDLQAIGTKIPPGGGGSRWARIVSGSYDESVIIWKRDHDGKWQVKHSLMQDSLLRNLRNRRLHHHHHHHHHHHLPQQQNAAPPNAGGAGNANINTDTNAAGVGAGAGTITGAGAGAGAGAVNANAAINAQMQQMLAAAQGQTAALNALVGHAPSAAQAAVAPTALTSSAAQSDLHSAIHTLSNATALIAAHQQHNAASSPAGSSTAAAAAAAAAMGQANGNHPGPPAATPAQTAASQQNPGASATAAPNPNQQQHQQQQAQPQQAAAQQHAPYQQQQPPAQQVNQVQQQQNAAAGAGAGAGAAQGGGPHRENNRVFKLQFDARRILCCSQNKVIVGWDFANGDEELERIGEWSSETQ